MLTELFRKQAPRYHINPRFRAYGKARIDIARRATTRRDWDDLWKEPTFPFPFDWGKWWKQCIEYKVDDFAAEIGFYIDILGLPVNAFDPEYAMFTSPSQDFFLAVVPKPDGGQSTPADALRIQFMVADILKTTQELERRGVVFEQWPQPCQPGSDMYIGFFRTPHGVCVDLWGVVTAEEQAEAQRKQSQAEEALREQVVEEQAQHGGGWQDEEDETGEDWEAEEDPQDEPDFSYMANPQPHMKSQVDEPVKAEEEDEAEELNFGVAEDEEMDKDERDLEDEMELDEDDLKEDDDPYLEYTYEDDPDAL